MKATVYNFFKEGTKYIYCKDGQLFYFSSEMMDCLKQQYQLKGWHIFESEYTISVSYTHENIEGFLKKLLN